MIGAGAVRIWRFRRIVGGIVGREFRARYAGSTLGVAWAILGPAVQFGLYLVVFSVLLGMRFEDDPGVGSYGFYLVAGLVPFLALQEVWGYAAVMLPRQAPLVRHVAVPLEVLVAGSLGAVLARYTIAFSLVLFAALSAGRLVFGALGWLLLACVLLVALAWGGSQVLAIAGAYILDLGEVMTTALLVLFFTTPVFYTPSQVPHRLAWWFTVNPLSGLLQAFRACITGQPPSHAAVAVTIGFAVVLLWLGGAIFSRRARAVRDII